MMRDIGVVPDGWYVMWCEVCLLSVSFTDTDAASYGVEWFVVLQEACEHEHESVLP